MTTITLQVTELDALAQKYTETAATLDTQLAIVKQAMDTLAATFTGQAAGTFFTDFTQAQRYLATIAPLCREAAAGITRYEVELGQTENQQGGLWNSLWQLITLLQSYTD